MFTKSDLAKFILSFEELPHVVSKGAQKASLEIQQTGALFK